MLRTALVSFVQSPTESEADVQLATLLGAEVDAVLRQAVRRALGSRADEALIADLQSEARIRLLTRLRQLRAGGEPPAIDDFAAYAATVASNAAYVWLRRRYPDRTRLKNQLRYAVSRDRRIHLEQDAQGRACCRAARLQTSPPAGALRRFLDDPAGFADEHTIPTRDRPIVSLVVDLLERLDAPIEVEELLDALSSLLKVQAGPVEVAAEAANDAPASTGDPVAHLDDRRALEQIWREILNLRPRQRAALLLNLREPGGGPALALVHLTGIASMSEIASALELSIERLTALWSDLPLDDRHVADRLNATRQQVINLRKTARATLIRRLARRGRSADRKSAW